MSKLQPLASPSTAPARAVLNANENNAISEYSPYSPSFLRKGIGIKNSGAEEVQEYAPALRGKVLGEIGAVGAVNASRKILRVQNAKPGSGEKMVKKRFDFGVNERGIPLGEAHHAAKLTDAQAEEIRELYDTGNYGYGKLAKLFGVSKQTIKEIVTFEKRASSPAAYRTRWIEVDASFAVRPDWFRYGKPSDGK